MDPGPHSLYGSLLRFLAHPGALDLGTDVSDLGSEVGHLGTVELEGILESLDLCFLHSLYFLTQELDVLGTILALIEYTPVAVQQQVWSHFFLGAFDVAAHCYDGAGLRRLRANKGVGQDKPGTLDRCAGYLLGSRKDEAASNWS